MAHFFLAQHRLVPTCRLQQTRPPPCLVLVLGRWLGCWDALTAMQLPLVARARHVQRCKMEWVDCCEQASSFIYGVLFVLTMCFACGVFWIAVTAASWLPLCIMPRLRIPAGFILALASMLQRTTAQSRTSQPMCMAKYCTSDADCDCAPQELSSKYSCPRTEVACTEDAARLWAPVYCRKDQTCGEDHFKEFYNIFYGFLGVTFVYCCLHWRNGGCAVPKNKGKAFRIQQKYPGLPIKGTWYRPGLFKAQAIFM